MDFLQLAKERYSCRSLTDKPVEQEKIDAIIEAGMIAPTAANRQPFKIWVFTSEEALQQIKSTSSQAFIEPCPVVFVVGADTKEAWVREFDHANFAHVDASIVATQMMLEVHDLGLGTTWIGHFDVHKAAELFPEMKGYDLVAMFAVGYPSEDAKPSNSHTASKDIKDVVKCY